MDRHIACTNASGSLASAVLAALACRVLYLVDGTPCNLAIVCRLAEHGTKPGCPVSGRRKSGGRNSKTTKARRAEASSRSLSGMEPHLTQIVFCGAPRHEPFPPSLLCKHQELSSVRCDMLLASMAEDLLGTPCFLRQPTDRDNLSWRLDIGTREVGRCSEGHPETTAGFCSMPRLPHRAGRCTDVAGRSTFAYGKRDLCFVRQPAVLTEQPTCKANVPSTAARMDPQRQHFTTRSEQAQRCTPRTERGARGAFGASRSGARCEVHESRPGFSALASTEPPQAVHAD